MKEQAMTRMVAITGATGFVGQYVVRRLLEEKGVLVRCLVRKGSDREALAQLGERVSFYEGDVTDAASLNGLFDGAWGAINLAGYRDFWSRSRKQFFVLNAKGAENVFQAALDAGVEKAVQVSTPLAFGVPDTIPFNEETPSGPHPSDYGASKHRGDALAWQLYEERGLPLTVVYLAAVIGAGDPFDTMEVRRAVERKLPALVGADTTYTYVYVRDAAEAIVRALLQPNTVGRRYLVGKERATTREYFGLIGDLAKVPVPRWNIPERLLIPTARAMEAVASLTGVRPLMPLDVLKTTAAGSLLFDGDRAVKELDMRYTSLREALAEAVAELQAK